jgi:hypothetical protein
MVTSGRIVIVLEQTVSERNQYAQEKMYESIDAGMRFVMLGDIILNKIGSYSESGISIPGPNTAQWTEENSGYHFKLSKSIRMTGTYPTVCVCLEHYVDLLPPEHALNRYAVLYNPFMVSEITVVDEKINPVLIEDLPAKKAAKEALHILSQQVGDEAEILLNKIFDKRFEEIAGRYVLSHLAIKKEDGPLAQISEEAIVQALVDHINNQVQIYEEEGQRSLRKDSPAKQTIVSDAIHEPPKINKHGRFVDIDIIQSAKIAQRAIGIMWNNTTSAES